jgi:hypothetical protein
MRSSTVFTLAVLAASAAPSFAAPLSSTTFAKRSEDESNAISLGTIGTIASVAAPVINGIIDHFRNKREFEELFSRTEESGAMLKLPPGYQIPYGGPFNHIAFSQARADVDPESGAILGALTGLIPPILNTVGDVINKREFEELLARADADDQSGAFLGALVRLIPTAINAIGNAVNKRELDELLARAVTEESGAFDWGKAANIGSIGSSIVSIAHNLFGGNNKRELEEIIARTIADAEDSGAFNWGKAADIGSIGSSIVSIAHNIFGGNKREFEELLARHGSPYAARSLNELD